MSCIGHDEILKHIVVKKNNKHMTLMSATTTLSLQLGFEPNINFVTSMLGKYPVNLHLNLSFQIFVNIDITQPQIVDVITPLLRIVPLDPTLLYSIHLWRL